MIQRDHQSLSLSRQCTLLGLSRSALYYTPLGESAATLTLLRRIDELYLQYPFYGSRYVMEEPVIAPTSHDRPRITGVRISPISRCRTASWVAIMDWASRRVLAWRLR